MADTQALQSPGISHVVQLEQWLMEGAYNKVLDARPKLPDPAYGYFMEKLLSTVRWGALLEWKTALRDWSSLHIPPSYSGNWVVVIEQRRMAAGMRLRTAANGRTRRCQ